LSSTLVTGATGFTGSHLCRRLVADGHHVIALVRPTSRTRELEEMGVECRVADICDRAALRTAFPRVDVVFHLAAAYRTEHADRTVFERVNVQATENLLATALEAGVGRFVHCSTVGVQGHIEDPPAREEYRFRPGDHYQRSKLEGELLARSYADRGLDVTVVRPVGIYGPGDSRFLKLFRAIARGRFIMIGSGEVLYHLTFVDDLVEGFVLAGSSPAARGEVFTIGGPRYTTLRELVNLIADTLGRPHPRGRIPFWPVHAAAVVCERVCRPLGIAPPLYPRRVEFFTHDRAFDISKARRLLGYEPRVDLEEGLGRTAAWYREQGLL
jgi:nucleoside-diphosphate-sugar epimerase